MLSSKLISQASQESKDQAAKYVEENYDWIEHVAYRLYHDHCELRVWWVRDDLIQAALVAAWEAVIEFNPLLSPHPDPRRWVGQKIERRIRRMIRRGLIRRPRKDSRFYKEWRSKMVWPIHVLEEHEWVDCPYYEDSGPRSVENQEEVERLVAGIKPLYRDAVAFQYGVLGRPKLSGEEAAAELGLTLAAYYLRANRGLHQMRGVAHAG